MTDVRSEVPLLVVFTNITRATFQNERTTDTATAETLDAYYERIGNAVALAGGTLIKFIGDGSLFVFPDDKVDIGIRTVLELKQSVDRLLAERGWGESRLHAKVHFGPVVAGPFGPVGAKRFDIIGKVANTAARLESTGVTLSTAAFRKLGPEMRKQFNCRAGPPRPSDQLGYRTFRSFVRADGQCLPNLEFVRRRMQSPAGYAPPPASQLREQAS